MFYNLEEQKISYEEFLHNFFQLNTNGITKETSVEGYFPVSSDSNNSTVNTYDLEPSKEWFSSSNIDPLNGVNLSLPDHNQLMPNHLYNDIINIFIARINYLGNKYIIPKLLNKKYSEAAKALYEAVLILQNISGENPENQNEKLTLYQYLLYLSYAEIYFSQGNYTEAIKHYNLALQFASDQNQSNLITANLYLTNAKQTPKNPQKYTDTATTLLTQIQVSDEEPSLFLR